MSRLLTLVRTLRGLPPPGMSLADARLAGLSPPAGWTPPPHARPLDAARTAATLALLATRFMRAARRRDPSAPSADTTTAAGLALLRRECATVLGRLGVDVRVAGAERVPAAGGLVFMWNQTSHLDHAILPLAIPRPFHTTYNNEVRRTPFYGAYLRASEHFWLDRTDESQWRAALDRAAGRIRAGACVLVSPEGTRSWDGRLLPMKRGAFLLARAAARPIVCVTVLGARDLLPRGRAAVRPGAVRIVLAPPIAVDATTEPHLESLVVSTFEAELRRA